MARRLPIMLLLACLAAPAVAAEQVPASSAEAPARTAEARGDREREVDRNCLRETGTRIRFRAGDRRCTASSGRVYTREDIDSTGEVDIARALRRLDASIY